MNYNGRGRIAQWKAYLLPTQQPRGLNLSIHEIFSEQIWKLLWLINGTAWNSGQRLDNVDRTHLVLASGNLVLQKRLMKIFTLVPFHHLCIRLGSGNGFRSSRFKTNKW